MQKISLLSWRISELIANPRPLTHERKLFSRSALGMNRDAKFNRHDISVRGWLGVCSYRSCVEERRLGFRVSRASLPRLSGKALGCRGGRFRGFTLSLALLWLRGVTLRNVPALLAGRLREGRGEKRFDQRKQPRGAGGGDDFHVVGVGQDGELCMRQQAVDFNSVFRTDDVAIAA
jgi:hypothetical protein